MSHSRLGLAFGVCLIFALGGIRTGIGRPNVAHSAFQESSTPQNDQRLEAAIMPLVKAHDGDVGIAIKHLSSGETFVHNDQQAMPTASLVKLPLMVTAYHLAESESLDLEQRIALQDGDRVPGSGILRDHFSSGATLSIRDYIRLMMRYSDNTATNVVIDQVSLPATTQHMKKLGFVETRLNSKVYRGDSSIDPERSRRFGLGSTSAAEMVRLLSMLHSEELGDTETTLEMMNHLFACDDDSKLKRSLKRDVKVAHKTGAVSNCRTDAGIIFTKSGPVAVCVLTNRNGDRSWNDQNAAEILCGKIGLAVINRFGVDDSSAPLQVGATGRLVESLQRTLNARLEPSPRLAIDGDFGPATRGAVERFQRENLLKVSGVLDEETWKSLGTLIERDDPVPPPDVVNEQKLVKQPRTPLDDVPIVTCKAWAIGDGDGNVLWNSDGQRRLEAASTTKVMTAHVVLKLCDAHPEYLDEVITFSKAADRTIGSTTGIREGEQIDVKTLLYGLLLPSGNDAATAFAEHFGRKLAENDDEPAADAFVAEMNREAKRLGLTDARYMNPHGLSHPKHVISAANLLRLGAIAMEHPRFRKIVATRQFGCQVSSESGYTRNLLWKNTNRLLGIDGYFGIKTGTTGAAGACLLSIGEHEGETLMVVVLGSQSSTARYADSRNLFRWAWSQPRPQRKPAKE